MIKRKRKKVYRIKRVAQLVNKSVMVEAYNPEEAVKKLFNLYDLCPRCAYWNSVGLARYIIKEIK